MTIQFHIGAQELRGGLEPYAKRFDLLEIKRGHKNQIAVATLKKWRKSVPPHFAFAVVPPAVVCALSTSDAGFEPALEDTLLSMKNVQAACFLLKTPASVRPSASLKNKLLALRERLPKDVVRFVWEPSGLIEGGQAALMVKGTGIVVSVDPTQEAVPRGPVAYLRLRALGERRSFGLSLLTEVVAQVHAAGASEAFVVFDSNSAIADAKRFKSILREIASESRHEASSVRRGASLVRADDLDEDEEE
jgi:uncharacterized protein YecE (DUF72 family)